MATQTDLAPTLAAMVEDGLPSQQEAAVVIMQAVARSTLYPDGVTMKNIRPEIPDVVRDQYDKSIGATIGSLVRKGILTHTDKTAPSCNDRAGNRHRRMPVYNCDLPALKKYIDERSR